MCINVHIIFPKKKSDAYEHTHQTALRSLFILQCLEKIKDTGIHSKILPLIILNILRNRHML